MSPAPPPSRVATRREWDLAILVIGADLASRQDTVAMVEAVVCGSPVIVALAARDAGAGVFK